MISGYELMKQFFRQKLEETDLEALSVSEEERERKDPQSNATLGVDGFVKVTAEVPKGNGRLSRLRFDVKIPDGRLKVTEEELAEKTFAVSFVDLEISFIDTSRRQIYFKAADYHLKEVE